MTIPSGRPTAGPALPYGTQVRATSARISLTCVATCRHGNACGLVGERGPDELVTLYFHGTELHGARLNPAQIDALWRWLAGDHDPPLPDPAGSAVQTGVAAGDQGAARPS